MLGVVTVDPVAHSPDPASRASTLTRWQGTTLKSQALAMTAGAVLTPPGGTP